MNGIEAVLLPAVIVPIVGALIVVAGVKLEDAVEAGERPAGLRALSLTVYAVPLVNPDKKTKGSDGRYVDCRKSPLLTEYNMVLIPAVEDAVKFTKAVVFPVTTELITGALEVA